MPAVRLDLGLEMLLERHRRLEQPCALATIVATEGSTYRKAGARMLIEADGRITGLLSGGCLEEDLRERAQQVLAFGHPTIVEYDMRSADDLIFGIGAGCEGAMRIVVEPAGAGSRAAGALEAASERSRAGQGAALLVGIEGPAAGRGTRAWPAPATAPVEPDLVAACERVVAAATSESVRFAGGDLPTEAWIQYLAPTPRVLVCGGGLDAEPLVALLVGLGFGVTLADHRPAYAIPSRFPRATVLSTPPAALGATLELGGFFAAVVMSHHLASDAAYLALLAQSPIPYVGLLGPRARRARLLADLGPAAAGLAGRLRGPIGLDIGAVTPESIALAIAAEIHAFAAGRGGGALAEPGAFA